MVDKLTDAILNDIWKRKQREMDSEADKKDQTNIIDWLTRGHRDKAKKGTKELAEILAEPEIKADEIQSQEDIDSLPSESDLDEIRVKAGRNKTKDALKEQRTKLLDELREKIKTRAKGFASINTLRKSRRYSDKEAVKIIDERIRELEGEAKSYGSFFREIQSSETRAEADKTAKEADESEILTDREKQTLRRMAEQKVY